MDRKTIRKYLEPVEAEGLVSGGPAISAAEWSEKVKAWSRSWPIPGCGPRRLVPETLRTGVDKPDLYDPKINRSYAELGVHYGTLIDTARVVKPKDKSRVERPMPASGTASGGGGSSRPRRRCRPQP